MATAENPASQLGTLLAELRTLPDQISVAEACDDVRAVKNMRMGLEHIASQLRHVATKLDPTMYPELTFAQPVPAPPAAPWL